MSGMLWIPKGKLQVTYGFREVRIIASFCFDEASNSRMASLLPHAAFINLLCWCLQLSVGVTQTPRNFGVPCLDVQMGYGEVQSSHMLAYF